MKMSLTKLLALAIWLPSIILMSLSGFFLYENFNKYSNTNKSVKYLELTKKLEDMLVALGQERGTTSIYAVSKGKYPNSTKIVAQKRLNFNNAIRAYKKFLKENPEFLSQTKLVDTLVAKLPFVRKKIDSFQENYIKGDFFKYYTVLENALLNLESKILNKFPAAIKADYELKLSLQKIVAYSGITRGFGSYYITADTPMSEDEYKNVLLKYYHDSNILLTKVINNLQIQKMYISNEFIKNEDQIKNAIFYIQQANMEYYLNGDFNGYPIDALGYFKLFTDRITYFKKTTAYLNDKINKELETIISNATQTMNINVVIFIIAIIIGLLGIIVNRFMVNHIKTMSHLISSLTPIVGEEIRVDVSTTKGIDQALNIVEQAIKVTQEAIKKSEEATKAKSLFLANMSHEIRTPLNGILGFLELLETTELTEEQQDYINTISQSAKNLLQIVNNILDVSKIESNKVTLEIIDFKALDEFESTIELFATPTSQKGIELVTQISPDIPQVIKGDILKIKEILTNLLSNAVKFTHKGGTIKVKIQNRGIENNQVKLYFEITDTGIGMTEEQKKKVFEAFTQADESVTRKYGGTGLGLTIVKSYIEMMGGEIEVESEINRGTTFKFEIPFEVINGTPKYTKNLFSNKTLAVLNTQRRSLRIDTTLEYFNFFGVNKIGFNTIEEIEHIKEKEKIDGIVIFYDESDKSLLEDIINLKTPLIFVTSYPRKEEVSKFNYTSAIFDPNLPSKVVNAIDALKEEQTVKRRSARKQAHKEIYNLKVLIAEDNPINQKLLQTTLKTLGIESDIAQNGLEAFNKYTMNPEKYDAIFTDIQMPVMDGVEATYEILEFEKEEEIPHTPIIAVTANVLKGDREKFLGAGMDDYISKPINKEELLKVLEKVSEGEYVKNYEESTEEEKEIIEQENSSEEEILPVIEEPKVEEPKVEEPKVEEPKVEEPKVDSNLYILASNSEFLIKYIENALNDTPIKIVGNLKDLLMTFHSTIDKDVIILIEEEFDGEDIDKVISNLKQASKKAKVYTILAQKEHSLADGNINDLQPENILKTLKG